MRSSDLFVQALENEGVEYVFTVPGEETLHLIDSIRQSKIKLIVMRHEQGAGFMAATYGRITGKCGVCLVTLGPGATNLVTPVAFAQLGGMPLVVINGQKPIKKHKHGRFQVIDVVAMMTPITKFSKQIIDEHNIPALVKNAFRIAVEERPGVAHLELPEDIAAAEYSKEFLFKTHTVAKPIANMEVITKGIKYIEKAKKPLLLIGAGANREHIPKALETFISKFQIPFFSTQMGKGVANEHNDAFIGTAAISDYDFLHNAIKHADLLINIGHDVIEKPPFFMTVHTNTNNDYRNKHLFLKEEAKVIHINYTPAYIYENYFPSLEMIGDIEGIINTLIEKMRPQPHWDFSFYKKVQNQINENNIQSCQDSDFPISLPRLIKEIQDIVPKDSMLSLDNGMYKIWFARNYKSTYPTSLILDNALATMGAGLVSAMASKLLYPQRNVFAICGDGGFLMNSQELESAVRLKLNITILILQDNSYGMIKWKQKNLGFDVYGVNFDNPDFAKYAQAYGVNGYNIKDIFELRKMLQKCVRNDKGICLLAIPIDYSKHAHILEGNIFLNDSKKTP